MRVDGVRARALCVSRLQAWHKQGTSAVGTWIQGAASGGYIWKFGSNANGVGPSIVGADAR